MAPNFVLHLLFLLGSIEFGYSAKILVHTSVGKSHYLVMNAIAQELSSRGHEVVLPFPSCMQYAQNNPLIKPFHLQDEECLNFNGTKPEPVTDIITTINNVVNAMLTTCKAYVKSPVYKEMQDADIQVGEIFNPCSPITAAHLDIPYVGVFTSGLNIPLMDYWSPTSYSALSYIPYFGSVNPSTGLNFFQRVKNVLSYIGSNIVLRTLVFESKSDKFLQEMKILPGIRYADLVSSPVIVLVNGDFTFEEAQPISPDVKLIGPVLMKPAKPLPKEFEEFMQSSGDNGVVVVSFGSMDREGSSASLLQGLAAAFAKLPYKVLWKTKDNSSLSLGKNTRTFSWIPQNDLLAHTKTRLFVTHCGQNGIYESIYHGIPMVSVPFFGDQPDNSARVVSRGISIEVDRTGSKEEIEQQMFDAIIKVTSDPGYKERMQHLSRIVRSRVRTPVQEAGDWIEHVLKVKDMSHLKPLGNTMPFYQLYMLDVMAFIIIVLGSVCYILKALVMFIVKCFKKGKEEKPKSQ